MALLLASCPADRLARIQVDDDAGRAIAESVGPLEIDVAPGRYAVRATARGRIALARVAVEDTTVRVRLELGDYTSAAPTLGSTAFDSGHAALLDRLLATPTRTGAGLVVLVRHVDGTTTTPAVRIAIASGGRDVPLQWADTTGARGCAVELPPGLYIATIGGDVATAMAVPVWSSWRTIVVAPVVGGRPVAEHAALQCLAIGVGWAEAQAAAALTEELTGAARDGVAAAEIAATDAGETPLHHLLRGDAEALARFDPDRIVVPADLLAMEVEADPGGDVEAPSAEVDVPPVLARSADALLYHEARYPWSLGEHLSALYASRLASAVLFRWRVDGAAALPLAEAKRFHADVRRFARQRLGHRSLRRVAGAGARLGPAGWRMLAHVADRSFARRVSPRDVVQEPIGDLVLTTGLPAAALQAGLGEATRAARRWRRRQIGAAVAALLVGAALAWALLHNGGGDDRGPDAEETELDEDRTVTQDQPTAPIAADDTVDTPMGTPVDVAVTANDAGFTDEAEVVLDEPPSSGEARIRGRVVTYVPDPDFAGTDRFTYRLADGDARSDPATVTVRVLPVLFISDVATMEVFADDPPSDLIMQVELTSAFPETVTVAYTTAGVTATEGSDFSAASGSLTFAPGQTVAELTVPILSDDGAGEGDETFDVRLVDLTNAVLDPELGVGTVTILDQPSID